METSNSPLCHPPCKGLFIPDESERESEKDKRTSERDAKKIQTSKKIFVFTFAFAQCEWALRVHLYRCESESDITPRWVHRDKEFRYMSKIYLKYHPYTEVL